MIPKIIHQIWIGPDPEPIIWTNTWKKDYTSMYSDFEYKLWNNEMATEILKKYPPLETMYNIEQSFCGKADILRYVILYEHGGIYIDADSVWINNKNLTELINNTDSNCYMFAGKIPNCETLTNGVIGCSKHNEIMKLVIDKLEKKIKCGNNISISYYTRIRKNNGPSKILDPRLLNEICNGKITTYPSHYFYPILWHGITDIDGHKRMDLPKDSYMFQYGYTTNLLKDKLC